MPATWRREDYGYAAAALGAAALLLYLVFGNFGLLPSPIAGASPGANTYAIGSVDVITGIDGSPISRVPGARAGDPTTLPPAFAADVTAPRVGITTGSGTTVAVTEPAEVTGWATDAASGIEGVSVTYATDAGSDEVTARLACNAQRRSCTWSARVPSVAGEFTVTASAVDSKGNNVTSDAITITVVNAGGPVDDVAGEVGETVTNVPDALAQIVEGLLGFLGRS